jgi:hypothetical protein
MNVMLGREEFPQFCTIRTCNNVKSIFVIQQEFNGHDAVLAVSSRIHGQHYSYPDNILPGSNDIQVSFDPGVFQGHKRLHLALFFFTPTTKAPKAQSPLKQP